MTHEEIIRRATDLEQKLRAQAAVEINRTETYYSDGGTRTCNAFEIESQAVALKELLKLALARQDALLELERENASLRELLVYR